MLFILSTSIIFDLCHTVKYNNAPMLSLREDTFEHQVFGGTFAVRHIIHRSIWNLRATSVLSDFTGFEAAELKVIVTK